MVCALNHHSSVTISGTDNSTARMRESGKQGAEMGGIPQTNSTDASQKFSSYSSHFRLHWCGGSDWAREGYSHRASSKDWLNWKLRLLLLRLRFWSHRSAVKTRIMVWQEGLVLAIRGKECCYYTMRVKKCYWKFSEVLLLLPFPVIKVKGNPQPHSTGNMGKGSAFSGMKL